MELGSQIKKYRGELKLSQEELAEKVYVTRQKCLLFYVLDKRKCG